MVRNKKRPEYGQNFWVQSLYAHSRPEKEKVGSEKQRAIHVGYYDSAKAYRLINPDNVTVFKARDVLFFENQKCKDEPIKENLLFKLKLTVV